MQSQTPAAQYGRLRRARLAAARERQAQLEHERIPSPLRWQVALMSNEELDRWLECPREAAAVLAPGRVEIRRGPAPKVSGKFEVVLERGLMKLSALLMLGLLVSMCSQPVPEPPADCRTTGCADGFVCKDMGQEGWVCIEEPKPGTSPIPPSDCRETGCPDGQSCQKHEETGDWVCMDDKN